MAVTAKINLTGAWQALATAGEVSICPTHECVWAITGSATQPTVNGSPMDGGHMVSYYNPVAMTLTGTERLWVKAVGALGAVYVTADAPVA